MVLGAFGGRRVEAGGSGWKRVEAGGGEAVCGASLLTAGRRHSLEGYLWEFLALAE